MAFTANKCKQLAARIEKLETSLDNYANGERVLTITDGPESVNFQAGSGIPRALRVRLLELKRQYAKGSCAVVLGDEDTVIQTNRRALRPTVGHR